MSLPIRNILRFLLIIGIQVLVLNNVTVRSMINPDGFPAFTPYIYPLFILLLPANTPSWALLLVGFFTGLTVDAFMQTWGMHAAAATLIAFIRPIVLKSLLQVNPKDNLSFSPGLAKLGFQSYLIYAGILVFVHHLFYFVLETWSFGHPIFLVLKLLLSTVCSLVLILIYEIFSYRKQ